MGAHICRAIVQAEGIELVAAVDAVGQDEPIVEGSDVAVDTAIGRFRDTGTDVVIDFTHIDASRQNLPELAAAGIHAVVGTSGFDDDDHRAIRTAFTTSNCIIGPNFALSSVIMTRFAELAAPYFANAEIIELHHDKKVDAPSGTAMATVNRMAAASSDWGDDPTELEILDGARGGLGPAGIRVHSVRMRGLLSHQEVLLGDEGQSLSIRQDSYDVSSFMPGIILATRRIAEMPGLTLGLDSLLDF